MKFRHEYKHSINYFDYLSLKPRLDAVLKPDDHAFPTGSYLVRSLYFDNAEDKVLREKIEGLNKREKFRLRFYNNQFDFIRLEKKMKINGLCIKFSQAITREQCQLLLKGEKDFLKESNNSLFRELYTKMIYQGLRPKTIVEYKREAYIYPVSNVRITIDTDIRTGLYSTDFFNTELPTLGRKDMVFEVKYDAFIPEIISDIIQTNHRKTTSYSKYAACRIL